MHGRNEAIEKMLSLELDSIADRTFMGENILHIALTNKDPAIFTSVIKRVMKAIDQREDSSKIKRRLFNEQAEEGEYSAPINPLFIKGLIDGDATEKLLEEGNTMTPELKKVQKQLDKRCRILFPFLTLKS
ncbi:hypothetical protein TorRG33x02_159490 [Trema orientale]|uniref:Uncharacterized protein n=1 Tax=Trema orientale TaxID=63057 RepID=A0A2P5ES70_TREOI|nr:hypothetical protein TorRG33x02_159490 [Trema orientale]